MRVIRAVSKGLESFMAEFKLAQAEYNAAVAASVSSSPVSDSALASGHNSGLDNQ